MQKITDNETSMPQDVKAGAEEKKLFGEWDIMMFYLVDKSIEIITAEEYTARYEYGITNRYVFTRRDGNSKLSILQHSIVKIQYSKGTGGEK